MPRGSRFSPRVFLHCLQDEPLSPMQSSIITARIYQSMTLLSSLAQSEDYIRALQTVADVLAHALSTRHKVLFFGYGGSAADAQHLAAELSWRFLNNSLGLAGIALTTNTSVITAISNDLSYDEVFSRQVQAIGEPEDVAVGISTSGKSRNVLLAMEVARKKELVTVGLTGSRGDQLRSVVDHCICVPSEEVPRIQEAHILTGHILCELIELQIVQSTVDAQGTAE